MAIRQLLEAADMDTLGGGLEEKGQQRNSLYGHFDRGATLVPPWVSSGYNTLHDTTRPFAMNSSSPCSSPSY